MERIQKIFIAAAVVFQGMAYAVIWARELGYVSYDAGMLAVVGFSLAGFVFLLAGLGVDMCGEEDEG